MKYFTPYRLFSLLILLVISSLANSQVSVGLDMGIFQTQPDFPGTYGGEITGKYEVNSHFRTGASVGVFRGLENSEGVPKNTSISPISVIGEFLFLEKKFRPYVGLHMGALYITTRSSIGSSSNTYFTVTPVAGIHFQFRENFGFNFNAKHPFSFFRNEYSNKIDRFPSFGFGIGFFYCI